MKIVINTCFGGYGLSDAAIKRYAEIKGIKLYPEYPEKESAWSSATYYTVPREDRLPELTDLSSLPEGERESYHARKSAETISHYEIARNDPALVQAVEELGAAAADTYASLKVVEIPDDVEWEINDYDGVEHIAEKHRTWS